MAEISMTVEAREGKGKSFNRKLRSRGLAPGVVYGSGREPVPVSFDPKLLESKIRSSHAGINTLFGLEGDASVAERTVMVKELQREPLKGAVIHADFFEIDLTERLQVSVPLHLVGTAPGVVDGGVVEHSMRELELSCLPDAIPDEISVDISELEVGSSLHVGDLELPDGVELAASPELSVVSVVLPRVVEEVVPEDEEAIEGEEGAEETAEGEAGEEASGAGEAKGD